MLQADGKNYTAYFWASNAYSEDAQGKEIQIPGWISIASDGDLEDTELEPGKGFWITSPTAVTCEFTK